MRVVPRPRHERFAGLSCYTANLAGYLDPELPDVDGHLARSVRLAVRVDRASGRLAFSHHSWPLDRMPDGTRLAYTTLPPRAALVGIADELSRRGRVLVVTDGSRLAWSPSRHRGSPAPHWLLVTGRRGDRWHVVDAFAGLLPGGEQRPFTGWLASADLSDALALPARWTPEQQLRNELAFGFPTTVPRAAGPLWLRREPDDGRASGAALVGGEPDLDGEWLVGDPAVLPFLADHFTAAPALAAHSVDDVWTAAAHRVFRHTWESEQSDATGAERDRHVHAAAAWRQLPGALRFALDSAARGRARPSLLRRTFDHLLDADPDTEPPFAAPRRTPLTTPGREAR